MEMAGSGERKCREKLLKMAFCMSIYILLVLVAEGSAADNPQVKTKSGLIMGINKPSVLKPMTYTAFLGIPYAVPMTTEKQRFLPPEPVKPWTTVLNATADKDRCPQIEEDNAVGSEDCLYLNVYVPKENSTNLKPVLVWIHGGAFRQGNGNSSYYGPDFLLTEDIVIVSIQYRLGALGFLNLNLPDASGNMGLKDQVLALKWIKENIQFFNGDPNKITLVGQSAGGVSTDLHQLSDMSVGLFHRTISMSASPLCKYWAFQSNVEATGQAFDLGKELGVETENPTELLKVFRNVTTVELIKATGRLPLIPFRPTVERAPGVADKDKFLTTCTPKKYESGNYTKVPHLMGFTSNEILTLLKSIDDYIQFYNKEANFITSIPFIPGPVISLLNATFTKIQDAKVNFANLKLKELSKIYFQTGIDMKQRLLSVNNDFPIYYYRYNVASNFSAHKSEGFRFLDGVTHEDELPYLFFREHLNFPLDDPKFKLIRNRLVRLWANFVKYGNPTPQGQKDPILNNIVWPDSRGTGAHLEIDDDLRIVNERPTDLLITIYQTLGFGDSYIFNDCEPGQLNQIINSIPQIPHKIEELIELIQNYVKDWVNRGLIKANDVKDFIVNKAKDIVNGIKDKIGDIFGGIGNIFGKVRSNLV